MTDDIGAFVPGPRVRIDGCDGGPLSGLTFAAKDLFAVAGVKTGGGNHDWPTGRAIPDKHSWAVQTLLDAGATLIGKTITDEVSLGILGENAFDGTPKNVRAPGRVPGGSSSGSAAAVAAPRSAPTPVVRCACRRASAVSTASARRTAGST
jgi:amidase